MAKIQTHSFMLVICFALFAAAVYGKLCKKFEKPENPTCDRKFCPLERLIENEFGEDVPNKCISHG